MNIHDCGNGTPYQTAGRGDEHVRGLILHATAGSAAFDHRIFMGWEPKYPVSIHYYILKTGEVRQYVRDEDTAWHCGDSSFHGYEDFKLGQVTIGTELENLNTGTDPYPQAQYDAAVMLWRDTLIPAYSIPREWCARHVDIAPGRKTDPAGFPWSQFLDDCYEAAPIAFERRYRVRFNRSVVRQGPARSYPIAAYLDAAREFQADAIKFGEVIQGSDEWVHLSSGIGFITATAVERVDL
jgi:N-acetyl-anhydromuramyl-L-alanine amidase AmpD